MGAEVTNILPFPGMKPSQLTPQNVTTQAGRNAARLQALANLEAMNNAVKEHRQCMRQTNESMPWKEKTQAT